MKYLYHNYAHSPETVYPKHVGGFIGWLKNLGWKELEKHSSGSRTADYWKLQSPGGDVVLFYSFMDGAVSIRTEGGLVFLTQYDIAKICE